MQLCRNAVLIGSSGMLGQDLLESCRHLNGATLSAFPDRESLDLVDSDQVSGQLKTIGPNIIINAAAFTDVDQAEVQRDDAERVNHAGPALLAKLACELDSLLVHFSTDYVFNGRSLRAYRTDDEVDPINWYGETKLRGEEAIRRSGCRHLIIRSSWLFAAHGRNFVKTVLQIAEHHDSIDVASDQRGRPTSTRDLAEFTRRLILRGATGTYHVANVGDCSRYEFARAILEEARSECRLVPARTADFPRPARRPRFSVLDTSRAMTDVGQPRHWRDALSECLHVILNEGIETEQDRESLLCCG